MITTTEQARELFDYCDGALYWKFKTNKRHGIDLPAGTIDNRGYRTITLDGGKHGAHRLIWLWHGLELPKLPQMIDHINGDKQDNRLENLRVVKHAENGWNSKGSSLNKSGVRGVSWCNHYQRFVVQLYVRKKKIQARFKTFEEAAIFATEKRKEMHGEYFSERSA